MRWVVATVVLAQALGIAACSKPAPPPSRASYLLMETARLKSPPAQALVDYFLGALRPGESMGMACLGTGHFSERDVIARLSLDPRPSVAIQQKYLLRKRLDQFSPFPRPGSYVDVAGALLYALACLNETEAEDRYVILFVNFRKELIPEPVREFPLQMDQCHVVAIDLDEGNLAGQEQDAAAKRLATWKDWVEAGGGRWELVTDLKLLTSIFLSWPAPH
jgi:hypothetical protein